MSNPKLLMIDEPSLGLAPKILEVLYDTISRLRDEKITTILSEQNARQALTIANRGYVMENGRVIISDKSEALLNSDLVKKPPEYMEYIVVHEMAHLLEPTHNKRFVALMDQFIPKWHYYRDHLNQLPVSHEHWAY